MIQLIEHRQGTILPVRAKPGARTNELVDERDGALVVAVTARPEDGKANHAIIEVLAESLGLRKGQIVLTGGATSRQKKFLIVGIHREDLLSRIDAALEPTIYDVPDAGGSAPPS